MDRRRYLALVGSGLTLSIAGCAGDDGDDGGNGGTDDGGGETGSDDSSNGSEFQGPSGEDRTYVDLQYRDYLDYEVEEIKSAAGDTSYEDVFRNADDRRGDAVHFTGTVAQSLLPSDAFDVYLINTGSSERKPIYASYVGDNFIQGDEVELWGQILGIEIYETGLGPTNTVPGIAVAEMVLMD